jgi:hypothetical protein
VAITWPTDQPATEHADGGEVQLHRRRRELLAELLDVGRHVHRLEVDELGEAVQLAPGREPRHRPDVRLAGVGIADLRREELQEALGRVRPGREQRRHRGKRRRRAQPDG